MNNRTDQITSEDVMAYVDGELPPDRAAAVAAAIASDSELQRDMDDYVASSGALRHAYDDVLDEPVPENLRALTLGDDKVVPFKARREQRPVWQQALAAGVMLAVGLVIGSSWRGETPPDPSGITAGTIDAGHPLAGILDGAASGERQTLGAENVQIIQTFVAGGNHQVCREYQVMAAARGVTGIACRTDDAWRVEVIVDGAASDTRGQYLPASGAAQAALDQALYALDAGDGIDAEFERCLLENGWNASACSAN